MVNIQIRGNLIDIEMTSISKYNFDNLFTEKFSGEHIKDFLSTSSDCKTIYKNTLPIIEPNSEFQVTSFENDIASENSLVSIKDKISCSFAKTISN